MFLVDWISPSLIHRLTLVVLTMLVLLTLVSQFGQHLYLELTTHFRLQYVLAAIACAVVLTVLQSWKFLPIAILCAVLNAVYLSPYFSSKANAGLQQEGVRVRLFHANVLYNNRNYKALLEAVDQSNADIVLLQEVTGEWSEHIKDLSTKFPYFAVEPRQGGAGIAMFSRYPIDDLERLKLDETSHLALLARVKVNERTLAVLSMHPTTPITSLKFKNRNQQFSEAADLLKKIDGPKVLIGDLNITMWSPYFRQLVETSGLRDSRQGFGLNASWPVPLPSFLRLPIDHCLVSKDIQVDQFQLGARTGSDHLPIIVDLILGPILGPQASPPAR
jgi:endonuclease/exonuclease/phosphatase (EEP) superfamily protein YafD